MPGSWHATSLLGLQPDHGQGDGAPCADGNRGALAHGVNHAFGRPGGPMSRRQRVSIVIRLRTQELLDGLGVKRPATVSACRHLAGMLASDGMWASPMAIGAQPP